MLLDFIRHHWYDLGVISFFVTLYLFSKKHRQLSTTQKWLVANFLTVLIHQFEEYRFPGGFPAAMNIGVHRSTFPAGYPLNAHSALITNAFATYALYLPPIFFPRAIWAAIGPMILGFGQIPIHGFNINSKMGAFYNPGLASAVLLHVPIGIAYLRHVAKVGRLTLAQSALGIAYGVAIMYFLLGKYTFTIAPDMSTPHPFSHAELYRGGVADWLARHR